MDFNNSNNIDFNNNNNINFNNNNNNNNNENNKENNCGSSVWWNKILLIKVKNGKKNNKLKINYLLIIF